MKADIIDVANETAQAQTDDAIDRYRRLAAPEQARNDDGTWPTTECTDCGEDIEPARLEFGRVRCFACQTALEARGKLYGSR